MLTQIPNPLHVSIPEEQFLLQFLQRFKDDDQVICIQVFPGASCTKLLWEDFHKCDEQ